MTPDIDELLGRMSRRDKLDQLQIVWKQDLGEAAALARRGIGALFWPGNAADTNALQRVARDESPHGIPLLIGLDVVHGQRTTFPIPLAQAASFDLAVARTDAEVTAAEARAAGVSWTFSPMIDVSRDPRWGRVAEGFGEDPLVTARFGAAKVHGYQGGDLTAPTSIAATAKHFVGYGAAEGGRDYNTVDMSEQRLRNVYLTPFHAAVEAGAASIMAAFNTLSGVPMHANRRLLRDVLKGEWSFDGVVVGDAEGVVELAKHGVVASGSEAIALALTSGVDIEMGGHVIGDDGEPFPDADAVADAVLDDAVRRVLRLKAALGLFDDPFVDASAEPLAPTGVTRAAARTAAERSAVLLSNGGDLLPLGTGPVGSCSPAPTRAARTTSAPGCSTSRSVREPWRTPSAPSSRTRTSQSCRERGSPAATPSCSSRWWTHCPATTSSCSRWASRATSPARRRRGATCGCRATRRRSCTRSPTPGCRSRWCSRTGVRSTSPAGSTGPTPCWRRGTAASKRRRRSRGSSLGAASPGGRLPIAFPRSVGQVPEYDAHERTGRPASIGGQGPLSMTDWQLAGPGNVAEHFTSKYLDLDLGPLLPFGHGLSTTRFELADLRIDGADISAPEILAGARIGVSLTVTNTGERDGDDVLLLFVRDGVASIAPAVRRLAGFERVALPAGASRTVRFELDRESLGFWTNDPAGEHVVEPGAFTVSVSDGTSALDAELSVR